MTTEAGVPAADANAYVADYQRFIVDFDAAIRKEDANNLGALCGQFFVNRVMTFNRFVRRTAPYFLVAQGIDYHRLALMRDLDRNFARSMELDPDDRPLNALFELRGPEEAPESRAEAFYRMALTLRPGFDKAAFNLARLLEKRAPAQAIELYENIIAGEASLLRPHACFRLGRLSAAAGDLAAAAAHYRAALADGAHFGQHHADIAETFRRAGFLAEALEQFERAATATHYYPPEFNIVSPVDLDVDLVRAFRQATIPAN